MTLLLILMLTTNFGQQNTEQMEEQFFNLVLVRHGETDENVQSIIQGCKDTKLNQTGRYQAQCLAQSSQWDPSRFNKIYCSDLSRAYETCIILLNPDKSSQDRIITDKLLRERSFGVMEGRTLSELIHSARQANVPVPQFTAEAGESIKDVSIRVKTFFESRLLQEAKHGDTILIVSHGGVIRQMIEFLQTFDSDSSFDKNLACRIPPNTSLSEFKVFFADGKIKKVQCIGLHQIQHLNQKCQQQALSQPQINANVEI